MFAPGETTLPAARRARKSIGLHTEARKSVDKENATVDLGSTRTANKMSRSKSLGPGGLDALKQGSGNRRASLAAPSKPPRSILKPSVSALPEIPPLKKKATTPQKTDRRSNSTTNSDTNQSTVALRTEEEQQAAAREREERDRRDARRKSLANRRVSFAAEATLHTFHEIEYMQDSTASTDSSRRASSAANKSPAHGGTLHGVESAWHDQQADAPRRASQNQYGLEDKQRRSSGLPPANGNDQDDDTTSIIYSSDSEPADAVEELVSEDENEETSIDSDDDGTMMSIVTEEVTGTSVGSDRSDDTGGDSSTLDEALRLAAQRAGTQNLGEDEDQDDYDAEGEEVIPSFGWIKKSSEQKDQAPAPSRSTSDDTARSEDGTDMDMDMTGAFGGIIKPGEAQSPEKLQEEDMSMEVTRSFGGIVGSQQQFDAPQIRSDSEGDAPAEEQTMEFTTAIGGIRPSQVEEPGESDNDGNEDMSMELTTVVGGLLGKQKRQSAGPNRRGTFRKSYADDPDMSMDMTMGVGRILSGAGESKEADGDTTTGMDITADIGGIINHENGPSDTRHLGKRIMVEEVDKPNSPNKAIEAALSSQGSPKRPSSRSQQSAPPATENEDTGLWSFPGDGTRPAMTPSSPLVMDTTPRSRTPSPSKPRTPIPISTPTRTTNTQSRQRVTRSASRSASKSTSPPKSASPPKPSPRKKTATPSPIKAARRPSSSHGSSQVDRSTPSTITPQRRLSGLGVDRSGLGSPRVTAMLDRRGSLGDVASDFVPGKRGVSFQDPSLALTGVDEERQGEGARVGSRAVLEREVDGAQEDAEATLNLREMIDSLSPKRNQIKARKSLHVGSAKGLLGKRPAELDDDDDDEEEQDGVKRLKGHQGSPVKNVRLRNPPSKSETTGRIMRSSHTNFGQPTSTPMLFSPSKNTTNTTPRHHARFQTAEDEPTTREMDFNGSPAKGPASSPDEADDGRIHLQDFLNLTSIRFMELTTTKRRHTAAPNAFKDGGQTDGEDDMSIERCVVAGACTVPTLELYQHSCRELKKYISEGRRIVKEIESDTFEDNPPLFREYMTATPDVKSLMDNQFKNVKTHARLLSKAMWYEWRKKLQDGLKEGLVGISQGMDSDSRLLQKQEDLLSSVLPAAVSRYEALQEESSNLEVAARELADSDPAELHLARDELVSLDEDIAEKKRMIAQLQQQFEGSEAEVQQLAAKKADCQADIQESEKIREECRGWTSAEINVLRDRVDAIEREHGWAVTGISGTTLSMTYKREIELVFDTASFRPGQPSSRIDLWNIADNDDANFAQVKMAEKEFFLDCIRDHIRTLPQSETPVPRMLRIVSAGWETARRVTGQISRVNITFPTSVSRTSDFSVAITSSIMLVPLATRVEITLNLHGRGESGELDVSIKPEGKVIYGEHFNTGKIDEFLATRIGETAASEDVSDWSDAFVELKERLIARGRKEAKARQ